MQGYYGNLITVLRGSVIAQAVGFLALPILSRLYAPDDFGVLQSLIAVLSVLLIISVLRMELAVLSVPDEELTDLLSCLFTFCVLTSAFVLGLCLVYGAAGDVSAAGPIGTVLYVVPVIALLSGVGLVLHYLALRGKGFRTNADAKIAQSTANAGAGVALGFLNPAPLSLAIADGIGRLANVLVLAPCLLTSFWRSLRIPSLRLMYNVLNRHRDLWGFALPGAIINALGSAFTAIILLVIFSAHDAGQYALVERSIGMPVGMLAAAASQVFMADFAATNRSTADSRRSLMRKIVWSHFRLGLIPALLILAFAPMALPWCFGSAWVPAGYFAQALVPLYLCAFAIGPVNMALTLAGKQVHQFVWDLGRLLGVGATWAAIVIMEIPALPALWIYAAVASSCYLIYLLIADRVLAADDASRAQPSQAGTL